MRSHCASRPVVKAPASGISMSSVAAVPPMMFGFGDAQIPRQESVDLIEVCSYKFMSAPAHSKLTTHALL